MTSPLSWTPGKKTHFLPSFLPISEGLMASEADCSPLRGLCREEQAGSGFPLSLRDEPGRGKALYKGFSDAHIEKEGFNIRCWILSSTVHASHSCYSAVCNLRCSLLMLEALQCNAYITVRIMRDMFKTVLWLLSPPF